MFILETPFLHFLQVAGILSLDVFLSSCVLRLIGPGFSCHYTAVQAIRDPGGLILSPIYGTNQDHIWNHPGPYMEPPWTIYGTTHYHVWIATRGQFEKKDRGPPVFFCNSAPPSSASQEFGRIPDDIIRRCHSCRGAH